MSFNSPNDNGGGGVFGDTTLGDEFSTTTNYPVGYQQQQPQQAAPAGGAGVVTQAKVLEWANKKGITPQQAAAEIQARGFQIGG